jgi:hypothetical protein
MRHKAKIDWWIGASTLSGILLPGLVALVSSSLLVDALAAAVALLVIGCCGPQSYQTTGDELLIRMGFTTRRVAYRDITAVRSSLERIDIECGTERLMTISPQYPEAFLNDIASRAPHLARCGRELVSSTALAAYR